MRTFLAVSCENRNSWERNERVISLMLAFLVHHHRIFCSKFDSRFLNFELFQLRFAFASRKTHPTTSSTSAIKEVWSFVVRRASGVLLEKNRHCCMPSRWAKKQQHYTNYLIYSFPSMYPARVVCCEYILSLLAMLSFRCAIYLCACDRRSMNFETKRIRSVPRPTSSPSPPPIQYMGKLCTKVALYKSTTNYIIYLCTSETASWNAGTTIHRRIWCRREIMAITPWRG